MVVVGPLPLVDLLPDLVAVRSGLVAEGGRLLALTCRELEVVGALLVGVWHGAGRLLFNLAAVR